MRRKDLPKELGDRLFHALSNGNYAIHTEVECCLEDADDLDDFRREVKEAFNGLKAEMDAVTDILEAG